MSNQVKTGRVDWNKYTPWYANIEGKRRFFKTEKERDDAVAQYLRGNPEVTMTAREKVEWDWCKRHLPPGTSLRYVVEQFITTTNLDWTRTVREAATSYIEAREGEPGLRPRYTAMLRRKMERVIGEWGDEKLAGITPTKVEQFCRAQGSAHQQNDMRTYLSTFFNYCRRQRWLDKNPAEAAVVTLDRVIDPEPGFYQLDDVERLLGYVHAEEPRLLAPFALQLFCGIRTEEVTRLQWSDVKLGEFVNIRADVAKTAERRVIDWWPDNLTSWVEPVAQRIGPVAPTNYQVAKWKAHHRAEVKAVRNGMRHSYATYAVAKWQDAAKVALQLGHHDQHLLFRHYRNYASRAEGERYFQLAPTSA